MSSAKAAGYAIIFAIPRHNGLYVGHASDVMKFLPRYASSTIKLAPKARITDIIIAPKASRSLPFLNFNDTPSSDTITM